MKEAGRGIDALRGERLNTVTFVHDYMQLGFNALTLTAYTLPDVAADGRRWTHRDAGWRDAICERIGAVVSAVRCSGQQFAVDFVYGSVISISLRDEDYTGPEAFMLSGGAQSTLVG